MAWPDLTGSSTGCRDSRTEDWEGTGEGDGAKRPGLDQEGSPMTGPHLCHCESCRCCCSCSPYLPGPAGPQHIWVLQSPPAHQGSMGGTSHTTTLLPPLQAHSHHNPRCFLRDWFLAVHCASPLTPTDPAFVFPWANVSVLRRATSAGRSNVMNQP